jgi:hypothetical protein
MGKKSLHNLNPVPQDVWRYVCPSYPGPRTVVVMNGVHECGATVVIARIEELSRG